MKISNMKANLNALSGEWMKPEGFDDFEVKIRSLDCPESQALQQKLFREVLGRSATRRDKTVPGEVLDYVYARVLSEICVIDWRNAEDDAGAPQPFSAEALGAILLRDAPDGLVIKIGKTTRTLTTPDKKAFNFEGRILQDELLRLAQLVNRRDDDDSDEKVTADAEKNASSAGSGSDTASPPPSAQLA